MDIFLETVWFVSVYLMGVGTALTSNVSLVFISVLVFLHFALICLIILEKRKMHKKIAIRAMAATLISSPREHDPRRCY